MRNKFRPYRLASPSQTQQNPSLSDDSLSERADQLSEKRRPRSSYVSYESLPHSIPPSSSVYLIDLEDSYPSKNNFGLTKTTTYIWKNSPKKRGDLDLTKYPKYSLEQVPPVVNKRRRSVPISSRHIVLQRGKIDYWQNMKTVPDTILTTSCQKHTGSASNLLSPALTSPRRTNATGNIISITTTKRHQPSLLNRSQDTQWNIEGDGKQLRYQHLKWYSVDQLQKDDRPTIKPRIKRRSNPPVSDSATDTASSSEQHNRSAPPVLQQKNHFHLTNEGMKTAESFFG